MRVAEILLKIKRVSNDLDVSSAELRVAQVALVGAVIVAYGMIPTTLGGILVSVLTGITVFLLEIVKENKENK
ncbi:MAG: hypothetical protein ACRCZ0_10955 [Cetobacterium sp.]